jgi:hypothetical protein
VKLGFGIRGQVKCTVQIAIYSPFEWSCHSAVKQLPRKKIFDKLACSRAVAEWLKHF